MRKGAIIRAIMWGTVTLLLIAILTAMLVFPSGFAISLLDLDFSFGIITTHRYSHAEEYTVGNAELSEPIRAIDLEWDRGSVDLVAYDGDVLRVSEKTPPSNKDLQLHWRYNNEVLYIQPYASTWILNLSAREEKNLTVEIPYSMLFSLTMIEIESVSASVSLDGITANAVRIDTVSGDIMLSSTSAEVSELDSVSGRIFGNELDVRTLEIETSSSEISLAGAFRHISFDSVSGDAVIYGTVTPTSLTVDTVSGDMTLHCPQDDGFTLTFESVSGGFDCDFPIEKRGKRNICGAGAGSYRAETVSGDLNIRALPQT